MHSCFEIFDRAYADRNTRLAFAMQVPSGKELLIVATEKINSRKERPIRAMATFCPFCGMSVNDKNFAPAKETAK